MADSAAVAASCKDTAQDGRGYVLVLTDNDLETLLADYQTEDGDQSFPLLMRKFRELIM